MKQIHTAPSAYESKFLRRAGPALEAAERALFTDGSADARAAYRELSADLARFVGYADLSDVERAQ